MKTVFVFLALFALSACATHTKQGDRRPASTADICTEGYIYTSSLGCLVKSPCPEGQGLYNETCIAADVPFEEKTCPAGFGNHPSYGCVAKENCKGSQVMSGGKCVPTVTCAEGYIYTATYGCLPKGDCKENEATYGGNCIPADFTY